MPSSMTHLLALSVFLTKGLAEDVSTGYADVNRPYDLPSHVFQPALDSPAGIGTLALTDFGPSNGTWDLEILVASHVPLSEGADEDGDGFGNNQVGQLTTLAMLAPDLDAQLAVDGDEDICAIVFRGLTSEANRDAVGDDGTCENLSEECHDDLISAAEERDGCKAIELPDSCSEWFPEDIQIWGLVKSQIITAKDSWTDIDFAGVQSEALSATGRFFGHISNAERKGSDNAELEYERAITHIWPFILSWRNSTELRCLWPHTEMEDGGFVTEAPDRDYSEDDDNDDDNSAGRSKATLSLVPAALLATLVAVV